MRATPLGHQGNVRDYIGVRRDTSGSLTAGALKAVIQSVLVM